MSTNNEARCHVLKPVLNSKRLGQTDSMLPSVCHNHNARSLFFKLKGDEKI